MDNFRISVKSFIVNENNELLIVKRLDTDPHKPGIWEIPGGRLDIGENPYDGLKRETMEEVGMEIEILNPLHIHHFTRQDGQKITMITFLCKPKSKNITVGNEHTNHKWVPLETADSEIVDCYSQDLKNLKKYFIQK